MEKIIIYGKGGIGKSFIAANLSLTYAKQGKRVLHVGCDPKHDSTLSLLGNQPQRTVIDLINEKGRENLKKEDFIIKGIGGIDCIEAGGPKPGVGCAGHGISLMFEVLSSFDVIDPDNYDVVIYDVLGDVVCGGFAAPLKLNFGEKIVVVVSEEIMSLYAANNIMKAINHYQYNGIYLSGLILNVRDNSSGLAHLQQFKRSVSARFLGKIPRSRLVVASEYRKLPVIEMFPDSKIHSIFRRISTSITKTSRENTKDPKPLAQDEFSGMFDRFYLKDLMDKIKDER